MTAFRVRLKRNGGALVRETTLRAEVSDDLPKIVDEQEPGWELECAWPLKEA